MLSTCKICLIFLFLSLFQVIHAWNLTVDPLTSMLQDQNNRYIFLHGVNSVYKQFPYYPRTDHFNSNDSLSSQDFANLQQWGFKAVRLFISWDGFEPKQGQYNYTYLNKLKQIVKEAEKYGIGIIIDAHHDLYSKRFCGEGFPDWLVETKTFPAPLKVQLRYDEKGNPLKQDCMKIGFFKYYATEDVMSFSNDFFNNKRGMADKFINMWVNVVSYFKGESNVIGYDLLNQPSGANAWKNPYSFIAPGINNNKFLLPFYKKLFQQIRKIESNKLLMFQPSVADYFGEFYQNPDLYTNKSVMSYHTYCPFKNNHAEPTSEFKCDLMDFQYMRKRAKNAKQLKIGGLLTEFGSVPESDKGIREINRVLRFAEQNWHGWFYWQFKYNNDSTCSSNPPWEHSFYYPNGELQYKKIKALTYPYATAICGNPISQSHTNQSYALSFRVKKCQQKYTQIYLNEEFYFQKGFQISFSPPCPKCKLESYQKNYYRVIVDEQLIHSVLEIKVAGKI